VTIKDKYQLPLIQELGDRLGTVKFFTKVYRKDSFNLLRIANGDKWKTAFRTRYSSYHYNVIGLGLCNNSFSFLAMINEVLHHLLDEGFIVYIYDILIYSESMWQHVDLVHKLLQRLRDAGLHGLFKKSIFPLKVVNI